MVHPARRLTSSRAGRSGPKRPKGAELLRSRVTAVLGRAGHDHATNLLFLTVRGNTVELTVSCDGATGSGDSRPADVAGLCEAGPGSQTPATGEAPGWPL